MPKTARTLYRKVDLLSVLNGVPFGLALLDCDLRIIGVNQYLEVLTGYTDDKAKGIYYDYILRSNLLQKGNPFRAVLDSEEPAFVEGDIINRDRKKLPIRFAIAPLHAETGTLLGLIVTLEDISLLKDMDKKSSGLQSFEGIIGNSIKMQEVFELLPVFSQTDASALITGETGTGKDLIAEAIHNASKRSKYSFVKVNCGALPESLLESELFGYTRGAFTGADSDKPGMFRLANGGTIFLTEIGDLPLTLQVKLLTVLDDKEFYPLGSSKKVKVDVRVIAATHRDLKELVQQGKFREDLFYRLNVLRLDLPSLRGREGDIELLLDYFLSLFCTRLHKDIKGYDDETLEILLNYWYPGNIRELRNIVEHAAIICQTDRIAPENLPKYLFNHANRQEPLPEELGPIGLQSHHLNGEENLHADKEASAAGGMGWTDLEKKLIMDALMKTKGKRAEAAKMLGWGRSTLWRKMKNYNLN